MKSLDIRSDFDFLSFQDLGVKLRFRVLGFRVLGFVVCESEQLKPYEGIWACQRIRGTRRGQT